MAFEMRLPRKKMLATELVPSYQGKDLVVPGDVVASRSMFMRGYGTYTDGNNVISAVAGQLHRVDKLMCVDTFKNRYVGDVGDLVIGRVIEVQQRRWILDINTRLDCILLLSAVNLPGGELRRRSVEDELAMREYLEEGDLVSAEVQSVYPDGVLALHTRSLRYGKLGQGVLLQFTPTLIKRRKTHIHNLPCGASMILANNGFVWLYPTPGPDDFNPGGYITDLEPVEMADRKVISRLRNCVMALASFKIPLYDTSILYCYEASADHEIKDILKDDVMEEIIMLTQQKLSGQDYMDCDP